MEAQRYAVPELDLSACSPSIVDKINAVPALKTSTGKPQFIHSLAPFAALVPQNHMHIWWG